MNAQPLADQKNRPLGFPILSVLSALDTFVLGAFTALLVVNGLLNRLLEVYAPRDMDAASVILDVQDDLIPDLMICVAALLVLVLGTIGVAVWQRTRSQTLRYGTVLLVLALIAAGVWTWASPVGTTPSVLPMTPTPVIQVIPSLPTPVPSPTPIVQMPDKAITCFAETPDGALWYAFDEFDGVGGSPPGSQNHGLYRSKDRRISHFDLSGTIRVLETAPDGSLYVGVGRGILRYRMDTWETLAEITDGPSDFSRFFIPFDIAFAENGDVWVGGVYSLARFDGKAWTEYGVNVRRLLLAPDSSLWGEGWDGISGSDCCFVHVTSGDWVTYTHSADLPVSQDLRSDISDLMH